MNGYSKPDYQRDEAKRQEELKRKQALREKWDESERILNILRTFGSEKHQQATDEEVEAWSKRIGRY